MLVWLGSDGAIYALSIKNSCENNIFKISGSVSSLLKSLLSDADEKIFAFKYDYYYMLVIENKMLLMNYKTKDFGYKSSFSGHNANSEYVLWYYWEMPEQTEILHAFEANEKLCAFCAADFGRLNYFVDFSSETDLIFYYVKTMS